MLVPNNNKKIEMLCKKIGITDKPLLIKCAPTSFAQANECFPNVQEYIKQTGKGELIIGWSLWRTQLLYEAIFHGVLKVNNELIDITPHEIPTSQILFIQDNRYKYEGKQIDNIRLNTSDNTVIDDFIEINVLKNRI